MPVQNELSEQNIKVRHEEQHWVVLVVVVACRFL
jgi:hypothetical protein